MEPRCLANAGFLPQPMRSLRTCWAFDTSSPLTCLSSQCKVLKETVPGKLLGCPHPFSTPSQGTQTSSSGMEVREEWDSASRRLNQIFRSPTPRHCLPRPRAHCGVSVGGQRGFRRRALSPAASMPAAPCSPTRKERDPGLAGGLCSLSEVLAKPRE